MARKSIIVVDDEKDIRCLIEKILAFKGYAIHTVGSGEELFALLPTVKPDAILLDVMLPGSNGFEICQRLKANPETAAIPVMMVTVLSKREFVEAGQSAGAVAFVSKPFDLDELETEVKLMLESPERANP